MPTSSLPIAAAARYGSSVSFFVCTALARFNLGFRRRHNC